MAKAKLQTAAVLRKETTVTRPGVHSKTKTSKSKGSKLYKKPYKGQGR
jgi:hypothetical protein